MTPTQQSRIEELLGQTELGEVLYFLYRKGLVHPSVSTYRDIDDSLANHMIHCLERDAEAKRLKNP